MRTESGRSLIEILGVLAITGVITGAAITTYTSTRTSSIRRIAEEELKQIAQDTKLLMEMRGDYRGVSVEYLVEQQVLKDKSAPLGGDWSITAASNGESFSINLTDLSEGECAYFVTRVPKWATTILVNGYETDIQSHCFSSATNHISFIVE